MIFHNDIIRLMRGDSMVHFPKSDCDKTIRAFHDDLQKIFDEADKMKNYRGMIMRGVFFIAFGAGCCPKEVVNAQVGDVDLEKSIARHPKGEGSWANPQ